MKMKFKRLTGVIFLAMVFMFVAPASGVVHSKASVKAPKYIFFFLGDGMSASQIQATEAFLATQYALDKEWPIGPSAGQIYSEYLLNSSNRLNMSRMHVAGMQTTYDSFSLMTDSASSATAFACGIKTVSGTIGMDDTKTYSYKSVAQLAKEQGRKVGVLTSVSLDHATPAAYYASVASRSYMNSIATQLAETGYEFFGGGGFVAPASANKTGDTANNIWDLLASKGYEIRNTKSSILALKDAPRDRVVCINPTLDDSSAMPYAIDQPKENLSLSEMTEVAIANLYTGWVEDWSWWGDDESSDNGFFIFVEGGKIDWACHANDAMAAIGDMLDFDNAVGVAMNFYRNHPRETLVLVTGDHETGGMSIGHATTAYKAYYERLFGQKMSYESFTANEWALHKAAYETATCPNVAAPDNLATNAEMVELLEEAFGIVWDELNDYQKEKLEDAYDKSLCGANDNSDAENKLLYGGYNPIVVTITHILNEQASIGWTSYSHTGVPVPIFAHGVEDYRFSGFYDNTDIARKIARVMGITKHLPIEK